MVPQGMSSKRTALCLSGIWAWSSQIPVRSLSCPVRTYNRSMYETTMYQERWANVVGLPRLKLCQLSVLVLTSAAKFSSVSGPQGSNVFLINCVAKWLNASWLDVLRDTNQPKKMMLRHFKEEFIIKNSVNGVAPLSHWKLRNDAIRVG
ncbi:hypothetical protein OUZ56_011259 [Daphnia magna]|uniref:Uncharacterized protein n=1 Tax=Daphnia magna TaxID=35525 RepID=A0ABQ9YZN7_9CRUS|nr:hypothetical protein OUZ56_011259 [Daphnia magna]